MKLKEMAIEASKIYGVTPEQILTAKLPRIGAQDTNLSAAKNYVAAMMYKQNQSLGSNHISEKLNVHSSTIREWIKSY